VHSRAFDLDWLVSPYPAASFLEFIWEKRPLHFSRNAGDYYAQLIDSHEINFVISSACKLDFQAVEGLSHDSSKFSCGTLTEVSQAFTHGRTIRVNRAQRFSHQLTLLCEALEEEFSCSVNLNLYCSPAQSRGLARHYDRHDVFVLQLGGRKTWRIYDSPVVAPLEYVPPLRGEPLEDAIRFRLQPTSESAEGRAVQLLEEFTLGAGDMCYVPRGYLHEAQAESVSYHITVGVQLLTYLDLLTASLANFAGQNVVARRSLPTGFDANEDQKEEIARMLQSLLSTLKETVDARAAVEDLIRAVSRRRQAESAGKNPSMYPTSRPA
jgi:ribosomal protein L16 Arg81 hydroxylase